MIVRPVMLMLIALGLVACDGSVSIDVSPEIPGDDYPGVVTCVDHLGDALERVNDLRAEGQYCGNDWYPPAPALAWNYDLERAAFNHSADMANYDFFSHTGINGDSVGDRVSDQGYAWRRVGENIAAGYDSLDSVLAGWLSSEGHCRNLMNADYVDMGLSCVANGSSTYGEYWTQVFATPK